MPLMSNVMPLVESLAQLPKYAKAEIERRWLVAATEVPNLDGQPYREIEDLYLAQTRLRLRKITVLGHEAQFKLCKKYGRNTPLTEPVTNLYLTEAEHQVLCELPGWLVQKKRYAMCGGSLDVYSRGEVIFEVEFESQAEALAYIPPPFASHEVTNDESYSGATLAERGA